MNDSFFQLLGTITTKKLSISEGLFSEEIKLVAKNTLFARKMSIPYCIWLNN